MSDCDLRKPGEEFCADCPLRPVRVKCERRGYCQRVQQTIPPSLQTRIGVFLLSSLALMLLPVLIHTIFDTVERGMGPWDLASKFIVAGGVGMGVVTAGAALVGLYSSVYSGAREGRMTRWVSRLLSR